MSSNPVDKFDGNYDGNDDAFSIEFLNSISESRVPNRNLMLKVGAPIMMLRNIDQSAGLCNGTRLLVDYLGDRIIQATVIFGSNIGYKVSIPRITLTATDNSKIPVALQRRQFPVSLCFTMIKRSKGSHYPMLVCSYLSRFLVMDNLTSQYLK